MNNDFPIQIFADGPKLEEITSLDTNLVKGFTFNPTLFRNLGVSNYLDYCKKLVETLYLETSKRDLTKL